MNDKYITIILHGSVANYPVYAHTESGAFGRSIPYDEISKYVSDIAQTYGISKIIINGSKVFAAPLVATIHDTAETIYSINNLEIEVIEE